MVIRTCASYIPRQLTDSLSLIRDRVGELRAPVNALFYQSSYATRTAATTLFSAVVISAYEFLPTPLGASAAVAAAVALPLLLTRPPAKKGPIIQDRPIGLPNSGNDCCFIAALQVLFNTPSWSSFLRKIPALSPIISAYAADQTKGLHLPDTRQRIDILEPGHWTHQEDPAAYMRALADQQGKQLSLRARYFSPDEKMLTDRGVLPPDDPLISLGIPSSQVPLTLNTLLTNYFCSPFAGSYNAAEDKLICEQGQTTLIRKTFADAPPEDLVIQIKRFGVRTPAHRSPEHNRLSQVYSWFDLIKQFFRALLGLPAEPTTPTFQDQKIQDPIETPLDLHMNAEWFENRQQPVDYVCQSFLVHLGDYIKSGHYVAYVCKQGQWYQCNDAVVQPISKEAAQEALRYSYIVSYRKVS